MRVNVKCTTCGKTFKAYCPTIKKAKAYKNMYLESKFTCWECIGVKGKFQSVGLIG